MKYIFSIILILSCLTSHASPIPFGKGSYISDRQLRNKAIAEGVLPERKSDFDLEKYLREANTAMVWLTAPRELKLKIIANVRELFESERNVTFNKSDEFYVDTINAVLHHRLNNEDYDYFTEGNGVGGTFKTMAIMIGDYNTQDGRTKMQILKDYADKNFEWYKDTFPEFIEKLEEMDNEVDTK